MENSRKCVQKHREKFFDVGEHRRRGLFGWNRWSFPILQGRRLRPHTTSSVFEGHQRLHATYFTLCYFTC